jgi:hypothetical protein
MLAFVGGRDRSDVLGGGEPGEELVASGRPLGVLVHDVPKESGDIVEPGVLGVVDALTVGPPVLQRVVLRRDQIIEHI